MCSQGMEELDKCHTSQQSSVQSELKKEMALLQKRILMDMVGLKFYFCSRPGGHGGSKVLLLPSWTWSEVLLLKVLIDMVAGSRIFSYSRPGGHGGSRFFFYSRPGGHGGSRFFFYSRPGGHGGSEVLLPS